MDDIIIEPCVFKQDDIIINSDCNIGDCSQSSREQTLQQEVDRLRRENLQMRFANQKPAQTTPIEMYRQKTKQNMDPKITQNIQAHTQSDIKKKLNNGRSPVDEYMALERMRSKGNIGGGKHVPHIKT